MMKIREHPMIRSLFFKEKLLIDVICQPNGRLDERRFWTKEKTEMIYRTGYKKGIDYLHDLKYIFTDYYMKFINFKAFDVEKWNKEHIGEELPIDTSYTLNDYFKSQAEKKFRHGMSRAALLNGMDSKYIVIIGIVVIGAGLAYLLMKGGL